MEQFRKPDGAGPVSNGGRKSHEAGFKHHLVKPIDLNKLDSIIQEGAADAAAQNLSALLREQVAWLRTKTSAC